MIDKNTVVDIVPTLTVRQVKTQQRRQHLSKIVTQLVAEKGFDAISVNEVAERASMSVGGLYRYISTKHDLLEMVCDEIHLECLEDLRGAAKKAKGIRQKLEAAYLYYWNRHWDAHVYIAIAYREYKSLPEATQQRYLQHQNTVAAFFADIIRAGVMAEEFAEVDAHMLAHEMILLAHMRALKGWMMTDYKREQVFEEHKNLVLRRLLVQ